jgi:hypothetical protein
VQVITLDDIDTGLAEVEAKKLPDQIDILENQRLEYAKLKNKLARSKIKNVKADRKMRKEYASRILRYLEWYSGVVGFLLLWNGTGWFGFHLDDDVAKTLVGSTAVAAIGLVGFIARGLFRSPPPTEINDQNS